MFRNFLFKFFDPNNFHNFGQTADSNGKYLKMCFVGTCKLNPCNNLCETGFAYIFFQFEDSEYFKNFAISVAEVIDLVEFSRSRSGPNGPLSALRMSPPQPLPPEGATFYLD